MRRNIQNLLMNEGAKFRHNDNKIEYQKSTRFCTKMPDWKKLHAQHYN